MAELINEETSFGMYKDEKRGVYTLLGIILISWGLIATPYPAIRLVAWIAIGLTLLTTWKVISELFSREVKTKD